MDTININDKICNRYWKLLQRVKSESEIELGITIKKINNKSLMHILNKFNTILSEL